jgi:DNA-binding IclR family transcriptional regulator
MGASFSGCFPLLKFVREELTSLVGELGETCYFGVLDGSNVLYLDKVESPQPLRMLTSTGRKLPAYATSIGKALLLQKSYDELCQMYPAGLSPLTARTVTELPVLFAQLQEGLANGYAWEVEESTEHIRCFAVPITKCGRIVASISVAIPLFSYQDEVKHTYISTLQKHANQISKVIEQTDAHFGEIF